MDRALETAVVKQRGGGLDLRVWWPYLGAFAVFTLDPTLTVELEAISALVETMEFGWRRVTSHRHTSSRLPAAILGTLSLEGPSSGKMKNSHSKDHIVWTLNTIRVSHIVLLFITLCLSVGCVRHAWWRPLQKPQLVTIQSCGAQSELIHLQYNPWTYGSGTIAEAGEERL